MLMGLGKAPAAGGGAAVPVLAWYTSDYVASGSTSLTTSKGANAIASGDLLVLISGIVDSSATNHSMTCPTGFIGFAWSPDYESNTNSGANTMGCWKIAGGSETGAYVANWTTTNSLYITWALLDITGANASPIDDTGLTRAGSAVDTTSVVAPTVSASGSNRLHLSCGLISGSGNNIYSGYPAGYTQAVDASFLTVLKIACAKKTVGSGSTGPTTWTATSVGHGAGVSILIKP
jgi:hypothetical protein